MTRPMEESAAVPKDSGSDDAHPKGRVLIVTPQPFFEERGTPIALLYVLHALTELGYAVDVLAFPIGTGPEIPGVRYFRTTNPLGIRSISIGFSLKKLVLDFFLLFALVGRLRRERYVRVHAVEESAFLAVAVCRFRRIPVLYDMASSLPEQLAQRLPFRGRVAQRILQSLERELLRRVDAVMCSVGLGGHVRALAPGTRCWEWRYPGVEHRCPAEQVKLLRRELGLSTGARVVLYAGSFEEYQGLPLLLAAIPAVLDQVPEACFVLVGATREEDLAGARGAIRADHRDRVHLLRRQPRERIEKFLGMAEVVVSSRSHGANLPLKIFDYLAAAKPIVATDIPAHRTVLDPTRAVLVPPSGAALAGGILEVLLQPERARELAAAAARYYEAEFGWTRFIELVGTIYEDAVRERKPLFSETASRRSA
jgi:glycosyltransferase involved in cell wall biosynthesis